MRLDPYKTQQAITGLDAEAMLLKCLFLALYKTHPHPSAVKTAFEAEVSALLQAAPPNTDPEQLIELQARLTFYLGDILG